MPIRSDSYYRRLAEDAVSDAGMFEPPVTLDKIAAFLGVPVRYYMMPIFFESAVVNEDGLPVVVVNSAVAEGRRRGALAHSLGHLLIVLGDPEGTYPRTTGEHREAALVAATLLMPDGLVMDQARKWFNDHRYLAGLFGVTEDEMFEKLVELGVVQSRGIRWDY